MIRAGRLAHPLRVTKHQITLWGGWSEPTPQSLRSTDRRHGARRHNEPVFRPYRTIRSHHGDTPADLDWWTNG